MLSKVFTTSCNDTPVFLHPCHVLRDVCHHASIVFSLLGNCSNDIQRPHTKLFVVRCWGTYYGYQSFLFVPSVVSNQQCSKSLYIQSLWQRVSCNLDRMYKTSSMNPNFRKRGKKNKDWSFICIMNAMNYTYIVTLWYHVICINHVQFNNFIWH